MQNINYNTNLKSLFAEYNNTNEGHVPLIPIDELSNIRGSGKYNPAPNYPLNNLDSTTLKLDETKSNNFYMSNLSQSPINSISLTNSWNNNINSNINLDTSDNYSNYDEYQRWALNRTRLSDPYILPYLFSHINVKYIQKMVVENIQKYKNITINTEQDIDNLLNLMVENYLLFYNSNGILFKNSSSDTIYTILAKLNKNIIEKYVKSVLSGINMHQYYIKDISNLPMPLTRPTFISDKGSKILGHVGFFEDNHNFTRNINSYNLRYNIPHKINDINFGN